ncbi:glycosyltransferase family 4 protein [Enterococcus cecorum]|uniref:glycosyltransferase family 4 protein n=1 Tax=Enterococcus cecorum TaxID=44008 RepID=UPI00148C1D63|nr:glycosyltransferase family 4 protein [Enterococcus cecorum]
MTKKKICFIAQFPPPIHGLSKAADTLYNSELNDTVNPDSDFVFEKVDITNNKKFLKNLVKISKSKADLFYFTISQTKGGNIRDLIIMKMLELQKKKCLVHLHGGYFRQLVDKDMLKWQRNANYRIIKKLSGVIVLSKSLRKIFKGMIDEKKIFIVENCVDNQYLLSETEIEYKLKNIENQEIIHVLWLSNFIKSKGYHHVLELARLEKKNVESGIARKFHFDFAGKFFNDTDLKSFLNYIKTNELEEYVSYHGTVEGEKKKELLRLCYIFILPTRYPIEGQPISIIEAMGNGMYIITTDHAGIPDIVEDGKNGMILKKDEQINLYNIQLNKLKEIIINNRKKCENRFNQQRYLNEMKNIFDKLI